MSNAEPMMTLQSVERIAASLDAQVRELLGPLQLSNSSLPLSDQLDGLLSPIYRSTVRRTKESIRAVAQEFRGTDRTRRLLEGARDAVRRVDILRSMLEATDVLALPDAGMTEIESDRLHRLHGHIATLRTAINTTISHLLRWQDEFNACQDVFSILELPAETLEVILVSLSTTIPDAHIARGRIVTHELIALWDERRVIVEQAIRLTGFESEVRRLEDRLDNQREIQDAVVESFSTLLQQLDDVPTAPVCFLGQEFLVRRFLGARQAFSCLRSQQLDISQDISRLERILDRFMDVVEA